MTTRECQSRDRRLIYRIESMFRVHQQLRQYSEGLQVSIENAAIILRGELPSVALMAELIPAVRQAGVLSRVLIDVQVADRAA